jgi:hypothetical protein
MIKCDPAEFCLFPQLLPKRHRGFLDISNGMRHKYNRLLQSS